MKTIKCLNSLRGIACIIVFIAHWWASDPAYGIYASGCGKIGVWCFMLLSGFFLMRSIVNQSELHFSIIEFYVKKFVRIYPVYVIALVFSAALGVLPWSELGGHLLIYKGMGHFWYMPVIIKLYIIWPIFAVMYKLLLKNKKLKNVNLVYGILLSITGLIFGVVFPFTTYIENSISLYWYMPVFIMGMILAILYLSIAEKKKSVLWDLVSAFGLVGIIIFTPYIRQVLWNIEPSGWLQNKYLLMSILWVFVILGLLWGKYIGNVLEKARVLQGIGGMSYAVYLFHYPILMKLNGFITDRWIKGILLMIFTLAVSWLVTMIMLNFSQKNKCARNLT